MLVVLFVVGFCLLLIVTLFVGGFILSVKEFKSGKVTAFESGFKGVGSIQISFSIHFVIMMLMFILFDLEVVMILGVLVSSGEGFWGVLMTIFFVVVGFYMEWWYGKLIWSY